MKKIPEENLRLIQEFTLFDDLYMNVFFKDFEEGAQWMLRLILDDPQIEIESVRVQEVVLNLTSKTSRFDIAATDKKTNHYDTEFQTVLYPDLKKRGRFYLSNEDMDRLPRGENYDTLADSYVIFICRGDVIGDGAPMHHFTMKDENGLELGDGQHLIFINADYAGDWRLKDLMEDFKEADPDKMRYDILKKKAERFKKEEVGIMYMNESLRDLVSKREQAAQLAGYEMAYEIAQREQYEKQTRIAQKMLADHMPAKKIAELLDMTVEEIERIRKSER